MPTRITIADSHRDWPLRFADLAERIRTTLGARALRLEHVGSTSVPGLAAKPIIDILLVVADAADEAEYRPPLEGAGFTFTLREPDWHEHRLFKRTDPAMHLHVFSAGCVEIDRMLAFRDRLRVDAHDCELYEATKRRLAQREWQSAYARAKTDVVREILQRALRSARA